MTKFCNDGRCPRTRAGEWIHPVHKIYKDRTKRQELFIAFILIAIFSLITPSFPHIESDQISYLETAYLAILIGICGIWYAWNSNIRLEKYVDLARYVQHATTYFNDEDWENAKIYYDSALEITPKNLNLLINAGASLSHLERFKDAIPYYDKVLEIEPDNIAALNNKGLSLDKLNKYDKAIECFEKALVIDDKDRNTLNNFGVLYLESLCHYDKAIEYFDKILSIDPTDASCFSNKAKALLAKGDYEDALDCCNKALKIDPRHVDSLNQKGNALFYLKRFKEVVSCGKLQLEIKPLHTKQLTRKLFQNTTLFNMAIAFASLEKYDEAISHWDLYLVTKSDDLDAWKFKGDCLDLIGNSKEALDCYNIGLQIDQNQPILLTNKGIVLAKVGKIVQSIMCFHEALRMRPSLKPALFHKAMHLSSNKFNKEYVDECYTEVASGESDNPDEMRIRADALSILKRYDEALQVIDRILEINPKFINVLRTKGNIFLDSGNHSEAITVFNEILQINPQHFDALNNKGDALARLGHYERAIECYDLILKIDSVNRNALYNKGHTLYQLKKFNQAIECFDGALETDPKDILALNNKGNCLAQLGKFENAIECYSKSLIIDPEHELPMKNLSLVYANMGNYAEAWNWWYRYLDMAGIGRNQIDAVIAKIQRDGIYSIRVIQYGDFFML